MAKRIRLFLTIPAAAALMLFVAFFVIRYRLVRVERVEVVDREVYAILEQAVDTLAKNSSLRNIAIFVTTTDDAIRLSSKFPCEFSLDWKTAGLTSIKGTRVFFDKDILKDDIPEVLAHKKKKSMIIVLSLNGINNDLEKGRVEDYWIDSFYKFTDGHWSAATYEETIAEYHKKEYERWRLDHPDTLDFESAIPPSFIEKYDSLNDRNFRAFVSDWERWSNQLKSLSTDSSLNSTLAKVLSEYRKDRIDTCSFLSFGDNIEIRKYQGKHSDYPIDYLVYDGLDIQWDYMMKASERYCYVPSIDTDKSVLYITPRIQRLLSLYIGGVSESEEDDYWDYEKRSAINEERLAGLRRLIPVDYGHWGGHWYFQTMPTVYSIHFFNDGYVVDMRTSSSEGEIVFYPFNLSQERECIDGWME